MDIMWRSSDAREKWYPGVTPGVAMMGVGRVAKNIIFNFLALAVALVLLKC
jgi:hypothetical protein